MQINKHKRTCKAITRSDTQCTRAALPLSAYCWQHESKLIRWLKRVFSISFILGVIGLVADLTGVGILSLFDIELPIHSDKMTGHVRVAVAEFDTRILHNENNIGFDVSNTVYETIASTLDELEPGVTVTVWGPTRVGKIEGKTAVERAENASDRAYKIDADILIYGTVDFSDDSWVITPEIFIKSRGLFDVAELTGQYKFGDSIQLTGGGDQIASRIIYSQEIANRVEILAKVVTGLSFYAIHDYETAYNLLSELASDEIWIDVGKKQLIYILVGNAAGRMGNIDDAERAYRVAIEYDPEYSRAYLGLASVLYSKSLIDIKESGDLSQANVDLLFDAIEIYKKSVLVTNIPPFSDTGIKMEFGMGQCYTMLGFAANHEYFNIAVQYLQSVIDEYDETENDRIQVFAGEAHARLALIYTYANEKESAIYEYGKAIDLLKTYPARYLLYEEAIEELSK